ncbi:NT-type C2 domain [Sesbania bispinosa]|nr:NT-type C2 domain [Sesbania bispinosa]
MVVKMMRWRPWPPLVSRKYQVRLIVRTLTGYDLLRESPHKDSRLTVEIKWKGPKLTLGSLRRNSVARNFTREADVAVDDAGAAVVVWDEEFQSLCNLNAYKDNVFHPWEIAFTLFNGLNQKPKRKAPVVGTALLNIAEYASSTDSKDFDLNIPLTLPGGSVEPSPSLSISISLVELRAAQESMEPVQRSIVPVASPPSQSGETTMTEKDELSAIKAGLRKVKIFTEYVSSRKVKKSCSEEEGSEGKCSRSEDGEYNYPLDSDSLDDFEEGDSDDVKEDSSVRKSFSYGTLAYANAGGSFYSNTRVNCDDEDWVYYSHRMSDVGCLQMEDSTLSSSEPYLLKRSILPWKRRKLSFKSPKANKGVPLLDKARAEGGDDIDFDRRQLSSDESLSLMLYKTEDDSCANRSSVSEFGDDNFAVGSWEQKEVMSRDAHMKLRTQVFFASIDQRSERAAGESACTALVAVIADWFQNYPDLMPIKSQFDSLIREGSSEWRNLCDNETYRERFPDRHFDLETVIEAKIRPLSVFPDKSFIGFFHPEGMDEGRFDFLHGAMSFDNIWDEISGSGHSLSSGEPHVYIVSWNDHFFILKVELDCYYIIDTLGERLYEGCNQAYILKFDSNTVIYKMQNDAQSSDDKTTSDQKTVAEVLDSNNKQVTQQANGKEVDSGAEKEEQVKNEQEEEVICRGKEACKEYIKSFLAAIPIRELQADVKKDLTSSTLAHQRLQIEFHYTQLLKSSFATTGIEPSMAAPETLALAITETST